MHAVRLVRAKHTQTVSHVMSLSVERAGRVRRPCLRWASGVSRLKIEVFRPARVARPLLPSVCGSRVRDAALFGSRLGASVVPPFPGIAPCRPFAAPEAPLLPREFPLPFLGEAYPES